MTPAHSTTSVVRMLVRHTLNPELSMMPARRSPELKRFEGAISAASLDAAVAGVAGPVTRNGFSQKMKPSFTPDAACAKATSPV